MNRHWAKGDRLLLWEKQGAVLDPLYRNGAEQFFASPPDSESCFRLHDRHIRCIDEGTPGGIHCAGSGILLGEEATLKMFERAMPDFIYSHEECGAVALWAKKTGRNPAGAGKYAIEWVEKISARAGIQHGHLAIGNMARPAGLHIARVIYLDGTGKFDSRGVSGVPAGFQISCRYLDPEYAAEELRVSISIALGEHGFGMDLITHDSPLLLIVIGDAASARHTSSKLRMLVERVVQNHPHKDRLRIDSFDAPLS